MGVDTQYWGPSAWQLFHLIAFRSARPEKLLSMIQEILPCKFCRASTAEYVKDHPLHKDPGKWLYEIHNMVNDKLRTQCKEDPLVINPGPDPAFEDVKRQYMSMKATDIPGRDFLFSVASNYPDKPEVSDIERQRLFIQTLVEVYPFEKLRKKFQKYLKERDIQLNNKKDYMKWMYGLLSTLSSAIPIELPSYKGYVQRVMYYTTGCEKKSYKGKTCRRVIGRGYTKDRDHKRTQKITRVSLL
jgi:hypothetical protein